MSFDEKRLYELLPAIYRIRDAEQGEPLKALLKVIAEQAGALEDNLAQLYDDQFAETCAPWVLPYIGDLIGITGLPGAGWQGLSARAEVARTIGSRRRKGTAGMLEQLARDVSGWPARAVEFFQLLAATQYMNHLRPENQSFISVRGAERLEYLDSAFEHATTGGADLTHTVDVRRIASGGGRYNIPNVGLFLWRLRSFSLTRSPAVPSVPGDQRHFFFSPLGIDAPLFNLPVTEVEVTHLAEPINVPDRIRRRVLQRNLDDYYGDGQSILLNVAGKDVLPDPNNHSEKVSDLIEVCDLSDWAHEPADKIAIDPVLGRIAFPKNQTEPPLATFYYGFSANMGGGEYSRLKTQMLDDKGDPVLHKFFGHLQVGDDPKTTFKDVQKALDHLGPEGGTVEIVNSGRYAEKLSITAGKRVELRAGDKQRPTLLPNGRIKISGGENDEVILDGLLIVGAGLQVGGELRRLVLRHCTLVPGLSLFSDGQPTRRRQPSLVIFSTNTIVEIDQSIVGGIQTMADTEVRIKDSIVDATNQNGVAYAGTLDHFGGPLRITNSTVIGRVRTTTMRLASNTIFLASPRSENEKQFAQSTEADKEFAPVLAQRRQQGCVRFSYLSPGAQVPSRYHCQPEQDDSLVRPRHVSRRFRDPEYCQLSPLCPPEIRQGADDESEMGAFHDLFEPQREAYLRTRIDEYLRFGLEAGIFYAS